MKTVLKVLGVLVVLGLMAGGAYYYYSQPRVISSSTETVTRCTSPDARDFYEKGGASYKSAVEDPEDGLSGIEDYCDYYVEGQESRAGRLRQSFCQGNTLVTENIDCGIDSVCRQGRCYKGPIFERKQLQSWSLCADSDGGMKRETRGVLEAASSGIDECYITSNPNQPEIDGTSTDKCTGPDCYVYEYYCEGDERAWKILPTPQGCENGAGKWTP